MRKLSGWERLGIAILSIWFFGILILGISIQYANTSGMTFAKIEWARLLIVAITPLPIFSGFIWLLTGGFSEKPARKRK